MAYKVYLSPSDQYGNKYPVGNTNEAEQCNRISKLCQAALERCGFEVKQNENMYTAVAESNNWAADLHVPIHTNAFNTVVAGTRIFCYAFRDRRGNETEGYRACQAIFDVLAPYTPGDSENIKEYPDLYEIKNTTAPCAYVEVDFHDNPEVAQWIIDNVEGIAEHICEGICNYFEVPYIPYTVESGRAPMYTVEFGKFYTKAEAEEWGSHLGNYVVREVVV